MVSDRLCRDRKEFQMANKNLCQLANLKERILIFKKVHVLNLYENVNINNEKMLIIYWVCDKIIKNHNRTEI